jgi:HK97 family phage portal protein
VATLQTHDGRLLRSRRPAGTGMDSMDGRGAFRPMWSDGSSDRESDAVLRSYEAIYGSQPVLAGVVDKLTRRVATLPLVAYQGRPGGPREPTTGDSLDTLLHRPMPGKGTVHLVAHIQQSLLIHGNALVAKLRGADREAPPVMLWPLDWSRTSAYGQEGGTVEWWSTAQFGGMERYVAAADVIHFAWPAPSGGEIGVSPMEKLGVTVRLEDAIQRHQAAMFRNGIRPSAAVSVDDPNPTDEKLKRAAAVVKAAHAGVDKGGSWVFIGANTKISPLSMSPVEVALIDQRRLDREEVGIVYDMPGPLMGDFEHATFANVTEMLRSLYRDVIPPWTELLVQTLQAQLIDPEPAWLDRFVRFSFDDKLKGDPSEQAAVDRSDVEAGIRTRDEARDGRGLRPMGGMAAKLSANLNNQAPVDQMGNPASSESASPAVDGR